MKSVVVVGSFNVDHVWRCEALPAPGATLSGTYETGPGGKGFNQAVAAARAGAPTVFVCALGADPGGAMARTLAAKDGIDLRADASERLTGTGGIFVDARGRNTIVIGPGANETLSSDYVAAQADAIAGCGVLLAQLESPGAAVATALAAARDAGALALFNPAPANAATSRELLSAADVLIPNETEFSALLLRHVGERLEPDAVAETDGLSLHNFCRLLFPHGTVVVTLGATGAFVSHAEGELRGDEKPYYRAAGEQAKTIDTTGAGDAFNGALAASLAGAPEAAFASHVRYANRYAALSTESAGAAASMPAAGLVEARYPA